VAFLEEKEGAAQGELVRMPKIKQDVVGWYCFFGGFRMSQCVKSEHGFQHFSVQVAILEYPSF